MTPSEALIEIDTFAFNRDIRELNHEYGKTLCEHLSTLNQENYEFLRYVAKRGESIAIKAKNLKRNSDVLLKIMLPNRQPLLDKFRYKLNLLLLPKSEREEFILSRSVERFINSGFAQREVHKNAKNDGFAYGIIPEVFLVSSKGNFPFIEMEFLENKELLVWVQTQTQASIFSFFILVVKMIENYLHRYEIVHCDIAHDNVLVNNDGMPILIDFGMYKNLSEERFLTRKSDDLGKPLFRSPEMANSPESRGYATDIYMLGLLLWIIWNKELPKYGEKLFSETSYKDFFQLTVCQFFFAMFFLLLLQIPPHKDSGGKFIFLGKN